MQGFVPLAIACVYVAGLFAMAGWVERRRDRVGRSGYRIPAYTLALGVYCTSWTFFGAVGSAAADGWSFLPIYLGPILVYLFAPAFLRRLIGAVHAEGATSISDFIGSRFGKSRGVAALVTLLALFGTVPYLALQLRSVGTSYSEITGQSGTFAPMALTALALALFALIFGTRRYEAAARNEAVLYAIAAESFVKLAALAAVAIFAFFLFAHAPLDLREAGLARLADNFAPHKLDLDFIVITLLAMVAIVCLPRQFYIGVIEARGPGDATRARLPFIGYLLATVAAVIPITIAGLALLPGTARPDLFVLSVPLAAGSKTLALIVFLGGFSAATAMAVVETIALSTMVSNDLIAPLLLRNRALSQANLGRTLLIVRRGAIILVMAVALSYALVVPIDRQLASIGLTAFVAMAQFAPALVYAVYRSDGDATAAKAGLATGLVLWAYTLLMPAIAGEDIIRLLTGTLLDPAALLGFDGLSPITHGALWSLGANAIAFAIFAARRVRPPALAFHFSRQAGIREVGDIGALLDLVARFVGAARVVEAFGERVARDAPVDRRSARIAERLIAAVVGAPSARAIMASALSGTGLKVSDVARMLDASSESQQFSRGLLAATLENIDPGVSAVDRHLNLVAWNSRYIELFQYPPGMVRVGAPVADLIRYNAERGDCGPGEVEEHVRRRLDHMRSGRGHIFERQRPDGRVLKTVGGPMPDGGYVMCFTDITAEAQARAQLERARVELETRVAERTAELSAANAALAHAMEDKTRFLAAASHDLLQPLHAARLFTAALEREVPDASKPVLHRIDRSIDAANSLLRALLDISRLDAGGIVPEVSRFAVRPMLEDLVESFAPLAAEKGLRLRLGPGEGALESDPTLLRSIVQNFLSNAVRYTDKGGILVGIRHRAGRLRIEVYDSGPGIPDDKHQIIFREFERLGTNGESGLGLGLAIVERAARQIGATVELRSRVGSGSRFAVALPALSMQKIAPATPPERPAFAPVQRVLIVDDDADNRDAMRLAAQGLGHRAVAAGDFETALACPGPFDAVLADFDLGAGPDGIELIDRLTAARPGLRAALVTAHRSADLLGRARQRGLVILPKPLSPTDLDDWLRDEASAAAQ